MIQLFKDKKYWKEMGIILLFGILINIACFCMPMITHAQTVDDNVFPYYIDNTYSYQTYDNINSFRDDYISQFKDVIYADFYTYSGLSSDTPILLDLYEVGDSTGSGYINLYLGVYTNPNVTDNISSSSLFSSTQVKINYDAFYYIQYRYYYQTNTFTYVTTSLRRSNYYVYLFGTPQIWSSSNLYDFPNTVQVLNYPMFMHNLDTLYSANNIPIITFTPTIDVGEFTDLPPLDEILNNISENYTPHTNSTPPTYDSNLSDGENISNAITGHSNNMNNAINNLGENVKNFFNKLYEKLTNVGNKISQNIYNGFSTLMQNIKDFFGPKLDSINDKLGQLVDHISQDEEESQQEIQSALQGTTFYQDFDDMKGLVTDSVAIWNSTSAPSEYKIPFHVERIAILNCDEVQYIDLSLFSPVFPYLRGVMWALVTYSLVYTVIDSIASYISGGDE